MPTLARRIYGRSHGLFKHLRFHNVHWWADPYRVLTKRFESEFESHNPHLVQMGNYMLDQRVPIAPSAIVYSAGVGKNIDFDHALLDAFGCEVLLLDPTPESIEFMATVHDPHLHFEPIGLWDDDTTLRFGRPGKWGGSASAMALQGEVEAFEGEVRTVPSVMASHGHDHLDLLKMDIEGAALPVMEHLLDAGVRPSQIVVEFERPTSGAVAIARFFARVADVCARMTDLGYETTVLPRTAAKYYSLEFLFASKSAMGSSGERST